jgi:glycosyltransferase involved in cell wall biosynthesis
VTWRSSCARSPPWSRAAAHPEAATAAPQTWVEAWRRPDTLGASAGRERTTSDALRLRKKGPTVELTLTAAICTRNRASWTRLALESLLAQDLGPERLDILVVDNGSTDDTLDVLREVADRHPTVRWCSEEAVGLSRARNRAIDEARGEVIAFIDDDAEASPSWASTHLAAFVADETVVATGGRITLAWPGERPTWLADEHESMYSGLDLGTEAQPFELPRFPFGANMAIRRTAFDTVGRFSTELGRQGTSLVSGEERDLFERLYRIGGRVLYLPMASVVHHVLPDRATRAWLLRRFYDQGRSEVLLDRARSQRRLFWLARSMWQLTLAVRFAATAGARAGMRRPAVDVARAVTRAAS